MHHKHTKQKKFEFNWGANLLKIRTIICHLVIFYTLTPKNGVGTGVAKFIIESTFFLCVMQKVIAVFH
jgi:hypothetical protein